MEEVKIVSTPTSSLWVIRNFSKFSLEKYESLVLNHHPVVKRYGKEMKQHRDIGFYSNTSKGYYYSGILMPSQKLNENLEKSLNRLNQFMFEDEKSHFNGILVNRYADGSEYVGAHSDSGNNVDVSMVACISYGATRNFVIRRSKTDKSDPKITISPDYSGKGAILADLPVNNGDLVVMEGTFQKHFTHEIVKDSVVTDPRISLTFRKHTD